MRGQGDFSVNGDVHVGLTALMCFPVGQSAAMEDESLVSLAFG